MTVPVAAGGSEFRLNPAILLSGEYNDNVLLTTESRYYDYVYRIAPSLSFLYRASAWDWDVAYSYNYLYYAKRTIDHDSTNTLNLTNVNRIIPEVLFLEVKDQYQRVSLDAVRDYTQESNFVNQSDKNLFTVNPYIVMRPLSQMTVTTGYIFQDTWYKDPAAVDRTDHIGYADIRRDLSPRSAVTAGVKRTWDENAVDGYTQDDLYVGLFHEYQEGSTITARVGNSWFDFETTDRTSQVFWDAVLTQRWPTVTVTYETGLRFVADPDGRLRREDRYLATVRNEAERTSLMVSGGVREYREVEHKNLETTSYRLSGTIGHAITTKSKIILDAVVERLRDHLSVVTTDRYLTGARFEHLAMENLMLALDYRFTNIYSPDVYRENYYNNRVIVELRKAF